MGCDMEMAFVRAAHVDSKHESERDGAEEWRAATVPGHGLRQLQFMYWWRGRGTADFRAAPRTLPTPHGSGPAAMTSFASARINSICSALYTTDVTAC